MDVVSLLAKIEQLQVKRADEASYVLGNFTSGDWYYGLDENNYLVFAVKSSTPNLLSTFQSTQKLIFTLNKKCHVSFPETKQELMHMLICTSQDETEKLAFLRLTAAFADMLPENGREGELIKLFNSLSKLFSQNTPRSVTDLQGFFAELYLILCFHDYDVLIHPYWQKKDKQKFDYSISAKKRLEVKSTLKESRIHVFNHEQLTADIYDIYVASVLLREDDRGISISDAVEMVREIAETDYETLKYIERFIKNVPQSDLDSLKYDEEYFRHNLRFVSAADVPQFSERQPDGVTNIRYESDLTGAKYKTIEEIIPWIKDSES